MCFDSEDGHDLTTGKSFKIDLKNLNLSVKTKSREKSKSPLFLLVSFIVSMKIQNLNKMTEA